jgi:gliding motility-associated lipoprotein GldH
MRYKLYFGIVAALLLMASCIATGNYEKKYPISNKAWSGNDIKSFSFMINDTAKLYHTFFHLQHTYEYLHSNIWLKIITKSPDGKSDTAKNLELMLSMPDGRWLGTTANNIAQEKINTSPNFAARKFKQKGKYTVYIQQIMRDEPLKEILSVGFSVEEALPLQTVTTP